MSGKMRNRIFDPLIIIRYALSYACTGNDRYSGDRYSGIDRFSGTKTSDDEAILFTANDYFSGNDRYSGTKKPDRFFHYNGRCLYNTAVGK